VVQNRIDLRADIGLGGGFIDRVRARAGYAAYRHFELEEDGAIATAVNSTGAEGRIELVQASRGGWTGASGIQYLHRDFHVAGEEAFLPINSTDQFGLFTLQQLDMGALRVEGGLRFEHSLLIADTDAGGRYFAGRRRFDALSGSAGISYAVARDIRIGANLSRTERAPSAEELFAAGPHAGTQAWELGNPDFTTEKGWSMEATLHLHRPGFALDASAYTTWFSDYIDDGQAARTACDIAAAPSGRTVDLPCFQYSQARARYHGLEADMTVLLGTAGDYTIKLDLLGDYVHASGADDAPLPRIPPARILAGLEAHSDRLTGRAEIEHALAQDRIADFETSTAAYTLVNGSISWKPLPDNERISLLLSANNLFDVDARRHASVLKDFAPLAGRDIRISARIGL
jgi:iron complex outermembrane receptor protein